MDLGENQGTVGAGLLESGEKSAFAGTKKSSASEVRKVGQIEFGLGVFCRSGCVGGELGGLGLSKVVSILDSPGSFAGFEKFVEEPEEGDGGEEEDEGQDGGGGHLGKVSTRTETMDGRGCRDNPAGVSATPSGGKTTDFNARSIGRADVGATSHRCYIG